MAKDITVDTINANTSGVGISCQGRTNGSSLSAGYVGEVLDVTVATSAVSASSSNSYNTVGSLSLTAGVWLITGFATQNRNGATSTTYGYIGVGFGTNNNAGPNLPAAGQQLVIGDGGTNATIRDTWVQNAVTANPIVYNISATTTVYLIALVTPYTGGPVQLGGRMTATRIV